MQEAVLSCLKAEHERATFWSQLGTTAFQTTLYIAHLGAGERENILIFSQTFLKMHENITCIVYFR